jgi:hypothetical protein
MTISRPAVAAELARAKLRSAFLSKWTYNIEMQNSLRRRMAATCFAVAMDHCDGICILLDREHPAEASAFALVRSVFEAYVRGLWLATCAIDEEAHAFSKDVLRPKMRPMLNGIGKAVSGGTKGLEQSYGANWDSMCAYAHTGAHQVQRWNTGDPIEPKYTEAEVCEILRYTGELALMAGAALASIAEKDKAEGAILERLATFRAETAAP